MTITATPWWKTTTVYHIYPRSFFDSNGDGIGDLQGILGRLDYLSSLGVETLWLSPFYRSPQADFGYDISDYLSIAPEYGSIEDVKLLIDEVHARGMKIVFDLVLNHTSDQHPWFLESQGSKLSDKRDYYIWRDGREPNGKAPPNNWRSMLGTSGWHYDPGSDQWYWASFLPFQPDLNYRNPAVKHAMLEVIRYWLGQGVDGFRLDIFNAIYKDASFTDNPACMRLIPTEDNPHGFFQRFVNTLDHPDTLAFARELRSLVDDFDDAPRFLVGEVFGSATTLRQYCGEKADGLHLVFLFKAMRTRFCARAVRKLITEFEHAFPEPFTPTYVFGNHDRPRFFDRIGGHLGKAKLFAMMQLTVRGVPFIYYGEEIGMRQHEIPLVQGLDPIATRHRFLPQWLARVAGRFGVLLNRDECRLPMQWHDGAHGGFSPAASTPWLPAHPLATTNNVASQELDASSLLHCYRQLLTLRRASKALSSGTLAFHDDRQLSRDVLGYERLYEGEGERESVSVFLNFSDRSNPLRLRRGRELFSNLRGHLGFVENDYTLAPYEGVMLFEEAS